ncbi:hypothetical protein NBRC10512_005608 [Rhodotorula toruloides]|uniref:RHTO0S15e01552g1_1 n=2 Tax=Rhodotorula toruloides TaxID=5286 RepID=A0A061BL04_RHOTO|nr:transcription factor, FAR1-related domain-containing protein [Rhodotorula toruloides NP11]EMS25508.1 transcription factor, FAR1-related domain-containing protein [Rhodotorula toruloides NP11]CDR47755.1 RHTO0S15e01552g1_1 [Rhodotorula toruloides]
MSSSCLPLPGTEFASPEALRLAVHKGCLAKGYELAVRHGGGFCGELGCRVAAKGGGACAFRLLYSGSGTQVHVTQIHEEHTCSQEVRMLRRLAARAWVRSKIVQLEAKLKQPGSTRPVQSSERTDTYNKDASDESEAEADEQQRSPHRSLRSRAAVDYHEPGLSLLSSCFNSDDEGAMEQSNEDNADQSGEGSVSTSAAKRQTFEWPQISEVREDASRVAETTCLAAPAVGDTFTSARDLPVQLHAFAAQMGFTMHRRRCSKDGSWVAIGCSRGRNRSKLSRQGKCACVVEADRDAHGSYRLSKVVLRHNHDLAPPNDVDEPEPEATPSAASTSASAPLAGPSNSHATTSFFSPPPLPSPQHPRFHFDTRQPQSQPAPARLPALAFVADLKALISLLIPDFSPASTSRLASQLVGAGVRSVSELTDFLLFEGDSVLPGFLEGLAYREGDEIAEDAFLFFQLLRAYSMDNA